MNNLLDLSGRVAIITGATGAIGTAAAHLFAEHGANVVVHYAQKKERAETLAEEIRLLGCQALAIQADVASAPDVQSMVGEVVRTFRRIDILVNNAGVRRKPGDHKYLLDVTDEEWDRELDSHLKGAFLCCRTCVPHMITQKFGRIINISSVVARTGAIGASVHYPAAKAGMFGFTKALANQVAAHQITANVVAPGIIDSERIRWRTPEQLKDHAAKVPLGRLGQASEVAAAILFLASPAASYITGATLDVNGGLCMA
jgi:NAD(P)-dependent dehydrogenase (short-subunit alcohol dehydrogenase family)